MEDKTTTKPKQSNTKNVSEPHTEPVKSTQATSTEPLTQPVVEKDDVVVSGTEKDQPVVVVMKPPKKNKAGIIAAVIFITLFLLASACLAAWYFLVYNSPENIAFDAVRQFVSSENIITEGSIRLTDSDSSDDHFVATINFNSSSNHIPQAIDVTLNFSERDTDDRIVDDHEIELSLGTAVMLDGVFYIQVSNLADSFNKIIYDDNADYSDYGDMIIIAEEIIDLIDNEWWQISLTDIAEEIGDEYGYLDDIAQFQKCLIDTVNQDYSAEFTSLYNDNRFLSIERLDQESSISGDSLYNVDIDYTVLANFMNRAIESTATENVLACYNDYQDASGFYYGNDGQPLTISNIPEITPSDVKVLIPEDMDLTLSISDFSHRLHSIDMSFNNNEVAMTGTLSFDYAANATTVPDGYRSITELFDEISEILADHFEFVDDNFEEGIL